jgi:hypothetical protein
MFGTVVLPIHWPQRQFTHVSCDFLSHALGYICRGRVQLEQQYLITYEKIQMSRMKCSGAMSLALLTMPVLIECKQSPWCDTLPHTILRMDHMVCNCSVESDDYRLHISPTRLPGPMPSCSPMWHSDSHAASMACGQEVNIVQIETLNARRISAQW